MADAYYRWSPGSERYVAANGRFVSRAAVRAALDVVLEAQMDQVRALSEDLLAGTATLDEWRAEMLSAIKTAHLEGAAVARGGWHQITVDDYTWIGQRIRSQLGYLQTFHDDLAYGRAPMDGTVASRSEMYIENGRASQRAMERRMAGDRGEELEKNIGVDDERTCDGCLEASDQGWVPIGTLLDVGERDCLSRDRCFMIYKTGKPDDEE